MAGMPFSMPAMIRRATNSFFCILNIKIIIPIKAYIIKKIYNGI